MTSTWKKFHDLVASSHYPCPMEEIFVDKNYYEKSEAEANDFIEEIISSNAWDAYTKAQMIRMFESGRVVNQILSIHNIYKF